MFKDEPNASSSVRTAASMMRFWMAASPTVPRPGGMCREWMTEGHLIRCCLMNWSETLWREWVKGRRGTQFQPRPQSQNNLENRTTEYTIHIWSPTFKDRVVDCKQTTMQFLAGVVLQGGGEIKAIFNNKLSSKQAAYLFFPEMFLAMSYLLCPKLVITQITVTLKMKDMILCFNTEKAWLCPYTHPII